MLKLLLKGWLSFMFVMGVLTYSPFDETSKTLRRIEEAAVLI